MNRGFKSLAYRCVGLNIAPPAQARRFARKYGNQMRLVQLLRQLQVEYVIDIGANKGWYSWALRQCGYKGEILCLEPIEGDFRHIRELSAGDPKWRSFNVAAGAQDGELHFNVISHMEGGAESTVFSSFNEPRDMKVAKKIAVPVRRVDDFLLQQVPELARSKIFLKTDTQGYDVKVLQGAERLMDRIVGMQSELSVIPIYKDSPPYLEALTYYQSLGFGLVDLQVVNRDKSGFVLEYDCLMAKRPK